MRVLLADDLDGLLPKEISGEGARALQGGAKAAAGVAGALFRLPTALDAAQRRSYPLILIVPSSSQPDPGTTTFC